MGINAYIATGGTIYEAPLIHTGISSSSCHIINAYGCISSVIYSLGMSEIDHIEVRPTKVMIYDLDSSGNYSNGTDAILTSSSTSGLYTITNSEGAEVGSVRVYPSSGYLQVNCTQKGYSTELSGSFIVIHQDGCESSLDQLISSTNNSFSMDVGYRYSDSATYGYYYADCLGTDMNVGDFTSSTYGTKTLTTTSSNNFILGAGITSGSGTFYSRFSFDTATINDASYDVVISYDTLDTNYL